MAAPGNQNDDSNQSAGANQDSEVNASSQEPTGTSPQQTADAPQVESLLDDFNTLRDRAEATMTLASAWAENLTSLVQLEFQRTLQAGKRIVVMLLFLFFLAIALIVSLCAGLGLLGYYYFQSIYIGFGIFMLSQIIILTVLLLSINRLKNLLGFDESRKQAQEALDNVTALFKQTD
ncbi:hypothetical protein Mag101_14055 [Microbulbifer agarilyticus]|uniref:Phage holin family protein n=1 Tax=Microbulbifer agarilyticus TaxID=260552 RepID=A0A1Q2M7V5_9GAMM|nr:hypothetical protein [Microbulbifer agarilyticus]AQQ68628.1 hypothetical protein Mag101_14055 [Microbulbifer agarilyticus]